MTLKNTLQILAAVAFTMGMQSCSDFLDKLPDDRTELDSVEKVQKLLMTAYPSANFAWVCEMSSDNLLDNQTPHLPSDPSKKQVLTYYNYDPYDRWEDELFRFDAASMATFNDYDSPGMIWEGYYMSIAQCNYALETLDRLKAEGEPETDFTRALRAEAQILRAFDHFYLANIFSQTYMSDAENQKNVGIPYVTTPETTMIREYERGTVAETYKMIKKDLEEALPYISEAYTKAPKYHFNTQAAHAFAARFYLFTHEWDKVIEHADAVLGTDSVTTEKLMMDYAPFDDCSTVDDHGKVWQNPDQACNLMLIGTNSLLQRRVFGNRYSLAGEKCQDVLLVRSSGSYWRGYILPIQSLVNGQAFSNSMHDYGFFSCKVAEEFQYSNKLAGIGYPHIMQRIFTSGQLLLERAEAKIMLGDLEGASRDLVQYWNSPLAHFSEATRERYSSYYTLMTDQLLRRSFNQYIEETQDKAGLTVYKRKLSSGNCYLTEEWQQFFADVEHPVAINDESAIYMNCLNEFRRYDTCFEGFRFFDLKRWGVTYEHRQGSPVETFVMKGKDDRRALEVAWESISSGLQSSRPTVSAPTTRCTLDLNSLKLPEE